MRSLLLLLAGCGFRIGIGGTDAAGGGDDAPDGDDGGSVPVIDEAPPSCDAPPPWSAAFTPTRTLHVNPNAVGGTQDGSLANPFMTISAAATAATPGTRILLAAGTYGQVTLTDLHGSATAPIWIEGPDTVQRANFTGVNGIRLNRPQYVVLQHLSFTSISGDAINADEGGQANIGMAHHLAMIDMQMASVTTSFQIRGVTDVAIYNSKMASGNRGVQLYGVQRAILARLSIASMTTAAVQFAAGSRDIVLRQSHIASAGTRAVWIGGNTLETDFRPLLAATDNYEARDVQVFNNFIHGEDHAIVCASCTDALIAANRITGALDYVIRVVNEHPSGINGHSFPMPATLRILGNAIEVTTNPFGTRMETNTTCATCVYDHNLWFMIDDPQDSTPVLPVTETNGIYGVPSGYDSQNRLCVGGAAIATGSALPEVNGTYAGECRAAPPSIGPSNPDGGC